MSTVNIPSYHDDPNYRYRMPRVKSKTEGRGNGVKTNVMNMGDISKAVKRSPDYLTKFCGCELGASCKYDSAEYKAIINGIHTETDIQIVIDKFIDKFVLCPKCKLPEIDLFVASNRVKGTCNACGFSGDMDNIHKVSTFICRNPPEADESTIGKKGNKKGKSKNKNKAIEAEEEEAEVQEEDVGILVEVPITEAVASKRESKEDRKARKEKERKEKLDKQAHEWETIRSVQEATIGVYTEKDFQAYLNEIKSAFMSHELNHSYRLFIVLCAIFKNITVDAPALTEKQDLLTQAFALEPDARSILKSFELLASNEHPEIFENYSLICHWLYANDIIEEEGFTRRYEQSKSKAIKVTDDLEKLARRKAECAIQNFLNWLVNAESASDESDSDS